MDTRIFNLSPKTHIPFEVLEDVNLLRLPLGERIPLKVLKKRVKVAKGACVAIHPSPNVGDMHAPFDGVVKDVTPTYIELEYAPLEPPAARPEQSGGEGAASGAGTAPAAAQAALAAPAAPAKAAAQAAPAAATPAAPVKAAAPAPATAATAEDLAMPVQPVCLDGLDAIELGKALKRLGVAVRPFTRPCELFIINAINPEPGLLYAEALLDGYMPVLEAGLALIRRLNSATEFLLALPQGSSHSLPGTTARHVKPQYPIALARPLIRALTGKEETKRVTLARLHNVFQLGLVALNGLPLTHTAVTAFGQNYIAPLGTPVTVFLEKAGCKPEEGDSVVLGGYMRGVAISGIRRGIRKVDDAMQIVRKNERPVLEDNPCINCGACVSVCPMRLRPNMLSRYAEFEQYESCRNEYIDTCIECGMCGWICPACRPMQQQFRMIKSVLGLSTFQHRLRA